MASEGRSDIKSSTARYLEIRFNGGTRPTAGARRPTLSAFFEFPCRLGAFNLVNLLPEKFWK
jgi:hypothetical protein